MAALRYSPPLLKTYNIRDVNYRFSVVAVNLETQPLTQSQINHSQVFMLRFTRHTRLEQIFTILLTFLPDHFT